MDCTTRLNVRETQLVIWNVVRKEPLCRPEAPTAPAASAHCPDTLPFSIQFCQQTESISTVEDNLFKIDAGVCRAPLRIPMDQNLRLFAPQPAFARAFEGGCGPCLDELLKNILRLLSCKPRASCSDQARSAASLRAAWGRA